MLELFTYSIPTEYNGCLYGSEDRRNNQIKRDQAVSLLLCLSVMCVLLYNKQLRRLYLPLARIVNATMILKVIDGCLYFAFYPYAENEGNCSEILVSRVYAGATMLGELHLVFFLATLLGLGRYKFQGVSLSAILNGLTVVIFVTILLSLYFRKLLIIRGLWSFLLSCLQIYFIRQSRISTNVRDDPLISGNSTSVRLFEKMSLCQLLPSGFSFVKRILGVCGIALFGNLVSVPNVMDDVCVMLFYLKVLIIAENADVKVEVLHDEDS
jgi:hypothetical protein